MPRGGVIILHMFSKIFNFVEILDLFMCAAGVTLTPYFNIDRCNCLIYKTIINLAGLESFA